MSTGTLRRHYRKTAGAPTKGVSGSPDPAVEQDEQGKTNPEVVGDVDASGATPPEQVAGSGVTEGAGADEAQGQESEDDERPEPPSRGASTQDWVDYAEANPLDEPLDLEPRTGLRDEIADAYLGTN